MRETHTSVLLKKAISISQRKTERTSGTYGRKRVAQQKIFLVLIKDSERGLGRIYSNNTDIGQLNLPEAKEKIKRLASAKLKA